MLDFYVYETDGEELGKFNFKDFVNLINSDNPITEKNVLVDRMALISALCSDKGYGYYLGYYVSYRKAKIMSKEENVKYIGESLKYLDPILKDVLKYKWDEDVYQDTLLYIINRENGVNNLLNSIKSKYHQIYIDKYRREEKRKKTCDIVALDNFLDFSEDRPVESIGKLCIEMSKEDDICRDEVNNLKALEILKDMLYSRFTSNKINIYFDYINNFRNKKRKGVLMGSRGIAEKYKMSRGAVISLIKNIEQYIQDIKEDFIERFEDVKYPSLDEYTLKNIIE